MALSTYDVEIIDLLEANYLTFLEWKLMVTVTLLRVPTNTEFAQILWGWRSHASGVGILDLLPQTLEAGV